MKRRQQFSEDAVRAHHLSFCVETLKAKYLTQLSRVLYEIYLIYSDF